MKKFLITCAMIFILMSSSVEASDARYLLNNAPLRPTITGAKICDDIVQKTLAQIITDNMTTYDKVKACYDWLIKNCSYGGYGGIINTTLFKDNQGNHMGTYNAYQILKNRAGVCDDYSCAFAAMTRAIGLNCYTIRGLTARADGGYTGHTWCVIKINGVEYVFDPQIDDNIARGGPIGYYRFCVTYDETPDSYGNARVATDYFKPLD